jgi:hypothetical protein
MGNMSRRLTALETVTSSVDRSVDQLAISRLTDAELDARIEAGEAEIRAAGGIDAYFGEDRDLAVSFRLLCKQSGHLKILDT